MIKFKMLSTTAQVPLQATPDAAGFDLYADMPGSYSLHPQGRALFSTGIACAIPRGYVGLIRPRSSLAKHAGIDVLAGVVDADYRGEVNVILVNHGHMPYKVLPGDRIAQLVVVPCLTEWQVVTTLNETIRGDGAFGSTGQ